ncbi:hypothetical protein BGZ98_007165 [Dissophora globulifera]|nr:hypothetical protein BGZ98_007165 [Dissophora globulifera]
MPAKEYRTRSSFTTRYNTKPNHPMLIELQQQRPIQDMTAAVDCAIRICQTQRKDLTARDFEFILETIQDYSTSQQQFWEAITTLIRWSIPQLKNNLINVDDWRETLAFAMIEVYWKQDASMFITQIERSRIHAAQEHGLEPVLEFSSEAEVLSHSMIDSLFMTFYPRRALELYAALSERGIGMPSRLLESFIRVAVAQKDSRQLECIGNMLLRHEELYQESLASATPDAKICNRPLIMLPKLMDTFIRGASENQQYELARAVFDRGLEIGQRYRTTTFTMILNSFSVKEFGFDIVANAMERQSRNRRRSRRRKTSSEIDTDSADKVQFPRTRPISVADPKEMEKYVSAMRRQGTKVNMVTLNVLVKLYLEMMQYKVPDAPAWKTAFKTYNPQRLEPDIVTYNTLLSYYEKRGDLATMRKIYDDMVGIPEGGFIKSWRVKKQQKKKKQLIQAENQDDSDSDGTDQFVSRVEESYASQTESHGHLQSQEHAEQSPDQQEERKRDRRLGSVSYPTQHVRSNRDIYTYNIMLHALLQHAVDTKDIASIGQCFQDMELDGISADTVTFNTNILYHISRGDLTSALQVFRSMEGVHARPSETSAVANGSWGGGRDSLLPDKRTDDDCWNKVFSKPVRSLPSYQSNATALPKTMHLYQDAEGQGVAEETAQLQDLSSRPSSQLRSTPSETEAAAASASASNTPPAPDVVTLTSLMSGFGQLDKMDQVAHFFKEMTNRYRIEPNLKTYSTLVAALRRSGDHVRAERLWDIVLEEDERQRKQDLSSKKEKGGSQHGDVETSSHNHDQEGGIWEDEMAERLQYQKLMDGHSNGHLTIMERRQVEARRKMYKDAL